MQCANGCTCRVTLELLPKCPCSCTFAMRCQCPALSDMLLVISCMLPLHPAGAVAAGQVRVCGRAPQQRCTAHPSTSWHQVATHVPSSNTPTASRPPGTATPALTHYGSPCLQPGSTSRQPEAVPLTTPHLCAVAAQQQRELRPHSEALASCAVPMESSRVHRYSVTAAGGG